MLEPVDHGGFEIGFGISGPFFHAEEFEDGRISEQIGRLSDYMSFFRQLANPLLVTAWSREAFVKAGGHLAFEFRLRPAGVAGLDLVEAAFVGIFDAQQHDVMRPTEVERNGGLLSRRLGIDEIFVGRLLPDVRGRQFPRRLLGNWCGRQFPRSLLGNLAWH